MWSAIVSPAIIILLGILIPMVLRQKHLHFHDRIMAFSQGFIGRIFTANDYSASLVCITPYSPYVARF